MKNNHFINIFFRFSCALTILFGITVHPELSAHTSQPAQKPLDSLLKVLPLLKDTARTHTLARIAVEYANIKDGDNMLLFKEKAFWEVRRPPAPATLFLLNFYAGSCFRPFGEWDSSLYYFNIAEKYTSSQTETLILAEFYTQKGKSLLGKSQETANLQTVISLLKKTLDIYGKKKHWIKFVQTQSYIGYLYLEYLSNPELALDYLETAYSMIEKQKINDRKLKIDVLMGLVRLYGNFQKPAQARAYLERAEHEAELLDDLDSKLYCAVYKAAMIYGQKNYRASIAAALKARTYARQLNNLDGIASIELNLGNAYEALNSLDTALTYYRQSGAHFKQLASVSNQGISNLFIAGIYFHQKKWQTARLYLDTARVQFQSLNYLDFLIQIARLDARVDSAQGDFRSAFLGRKEEEQLKDQMTGEEKIKNFEKIYEKFALERAHEKKRTQQMQAQTERVRQKNERDWLQISGACIGVFVVVGVGVFLMKKEISPLYGNLTLFIGILFFFEILLEILDRILTSSGFGAPLYRLFPNLIIGAILTPVFHFIRLRLLKNEK